MSNGLNTLFRKELSVNLSNSRYFTEAETSSMKAINEFIERDDVPRVSPGLKTVITRNNENILVRYRMSTLKTLYLKFCAESSLSSSFSSFTRNIPQNVKRPRPLTWDTCLCVKYLNPDLKLERLAKVEKDASRKALVKKNSRKLYKRSNKLRHRKEIPSSMLNGSW